MKKASFALAIHFLIFISVTHGQVQVNINGTEVQHTVSPMIQGFGLVYSQENDAMYADGQMAELFEDVGASFLRWPGGTITTRYHWDDLTGNGWSDTWNPNYNRANDKDPSTYMDLDEYMALCNQTGVEPMLGINLSSGMEWNREADGIQEAINLVNHCLDHDFSVKYFFLDNETYHPGNGYNADADNDGEEWTAESYAEQLNLYAAAIRQLIPDAKFIANWSHNIRGNNNLVTLITEAGDSFDYLDVHWYWKWGNASWSLLKSQLPLEIRPQYTVSDEVDYFNNLVAQHGKPHLKLASLEWNIGPGPWETDPAHTRFRTSLMQADIMMQLIKSGIEVASFWSTQWANTPAESDRFLVDSGNDYAPNPVANVFEMSKHAIGADVVSSSCSNDEIQTVTTIKGDKAYVYLLNKGEVNRTVEFNIDGYDINDVYQAIRFKDPGTVMDIGLWQVDHKYRAAIRANTFTMIVFDVRRQNFLFNGDFEQGLVNWNTWQQGSLTTENVHYGANAAKLMGNASISQWVKVTPSTTYTLSAFAMVSDPSNERVVFGARDETGSLLGKVDITDSEYTAQRVMFTTGPEIDSVKVFFWRPPAGVHASYLDEVVLTTTAYALNADGEKGLYAWSHYGGATAEFENPLSGLGSLAIDGKGGMSQWIKVKPGTDYKVTFTAMVEDASKPAKFHVKNSAGSKYFSYDILDLQANEHTIFFTTDPEDEDAQVGFWRPNGAIGKTFLDDLILTEESGGTSNMQVLNNATQELADDRLRAASVKAETEGIKVWPNPTSLELYLQLEDALDIVNISLRSPIGKHVLSRSGFAATNFYALPVGNLPAGIYLLIVEQADGTVFNKKIIIR